MNLFASSLCSLVFTTAIGFSIRIVGAGSRNWMSCAGVRAKQRLVLVGEQHVALAGEERAVSVRARSCPATTTCWKSFSR